VVVAKEGIGPVVAVSVKGTFGAYRNLVNRMEEAIGDSTNLHVMYPGLVYGFLHLLRANRERRGYHPRDMGIGADNSVSPLIKRYYAALCEMTGRRFVRNDSHAMSLSGLCSRRTMRRMQVPSTKASLRRTPLYVSSPSSAGCLRHTISDFRCVQTTCPWREESPRTVIPLFSNSLRRNKANPWMTSLDTRQGWASRAGVQGRRRTPANRATLFCPIEKPSPQYLGG